ncbi:hypothetical protein R6Q57_006151, partial [Mikania cordata]
MPRINTYVDDLISKSDHAHEFPSKPVSLTIDPDLENVNYSDDFETCAEKLSTSVSTSSDPGFSERDVKPLDPNEFYQKVCCYACGRPDHKARHYLHKPTEFFYGMNQKVIPKAKPINNPKRIEESSKPK